MKHHQFETDISTVVPAERLTAAMARPNAQHLRPILMAVRDHGCGLLIEPQVKPAETLPVFDLPANRPVIVLIGDDMDDAFGPRGFHSKSLRRAVTACAGATVISSGTLTPAYASAAMLAVMSRRSVILVETRLTQEQAWVNGLHRINPSLPVLLSTVAGGRA